MSPTCSTSSPSIEGSDPVDVATRFTSYGALKAACADAVVGVLEPIQQRYAELRADEGELRRHARRRSCACPGDLSAGARPGPLGDGPGRPRWLSCRNPAVGLDRLDQRVLDGESVEGAADGDGTGVGGGDPGGVGSQVVVLLLRPSLGLDPGGVGLDLVRDPLVVPAEDRRDQVGDGLGRLGAAVGRLDRDAGTPGEDVVEVQRALVARGVRRSRPGGTPPPRRAARAASGRPRPARAARRSSSRSGRAAAASATPAARPAWQAGRPG